MKALQPLKKLSLYIIAIIVFLIMQATCELTIPTYTSNIINIGIENKGIDYIIPKVITKNEYNNILKGLTDEDKKILISSFKHVSIYNISKREYLEYKEKYPIIDDTDIYLYKNKENDQRLSKIFENYITNKEDENDKSILTYIIKEYEKIGININNIQIKYILITGLKMILLTLFSVIASILVGYFCAILSSKYTIILREKIFAKVLTFNEEDLKKFKTSSLITRTTNDVSTIQRTIIMFFRIIIFAPLMGTGAIIKILTTDASMSLIISIAIILIFLISLFIIFNTLKNFNKFQKLIDKLNLVSRQIIKGIPVIKAFGNELVEEKRFNDVNKELEQKTISIEKVMSLIFPFITIILNVVTLLIVFVGANKITGGKIDLGTIFALIQYSTQVIMSFIMISAVSFIFPRSLISIKRINELLNHKVKIKDNNSLNKGLNIKGNITFKNVSFKYEDFKQNILENINFTIKEGDTFAIIGATGSGKSTLINLLIRMYDVTTGQILINNKNIKKIPLYLLREKISYVPQKSMILSGTIASNITYSSKQIDEKRMKEVSHIACLDELINENNQNYKMVVSQNATNLSGGQKQRLQIARALYKNSDIYIFDDCFSALDFKTESKIRKNLKNYLKEKTKIIVSQRISTIMDADLILVLEKGKIVGIDNHKNLLKNCEIYKEIASSQLTKEELN